MAKRIEIAPPTLEWGETWEKLAYGVIHKNLWRFHGSCEPEDLLQEAWGVFDHARARYLEFNASVVMKEFGCYFRSAFFRYLLDRAKHGNRRRIRMPIDGEITEGNEPAVRDSHEMDLEFQQLLESAPPDIRLLALRILNEDDENPLSNARLAELADVPPSHIGRIRRAFGRILGIDQ